VAGSAADGGIAFFQISLIEDVVSIVILMVTVETVKCIHVEFMGEADGRSLIACIGVTVVYHDLLFLPLGNGWDAWHGQQEDNRYPLYGFSYD
jgi:hypothetical protein